MTNRGPLAQMIYGNLLYALAVISLVGSLVAGLLLIAYSPPIHCGPFGNCLRTTHPDTVLGAVVITSGVVEAIVMGAIGAVARGVGELLARA